jgi:hypothetical protein
MSDHEPIFVADERAQLQTMLDATRAELVETLDGLTDEQARQRLVPSLTTPLSLLKHATVVEQVWFHVGLAGRTREELGLSYDIDDSFAIGPEDTVASVVADYHRVCDEARALVASCSMDDEVLHNRRSPLSLRWVHLHLISELARHAGHADILREQILDRAASEARRDPGADA